MYNYINVSNVNYIHCTYNYTYNLYISKLYTFLYIQTYSIYIYTIIHSYVLYIYIYVYFIILLSILMYILQTYIFSIVFYFCCWLISYTCFSS